MMRAAATSRVGFAAGLFGLLFAIGVWLGADSLHHDWFYDDLVLIREFPESQLASAMVGQWEPSGVSTLGYRPVNMLFNHLTYIAFGEDVFLHRLFRIALFAAQLVVLVLLAGEVGMPRWQGALAAVLIICTKNTWWMLVWPTDGVRSFVALLANGAAYLLLLDLRSPTLWKRVLSVVLFTTALVTREETLVYLAIIPALGMLWAICNINAGTIYRAPTGDGSGERARAWQRQSPTGGGLGRVKVWGWQRQDFTGGGASVFRKLVGYTAVLLVISAAFWLWRSRIVFGGTPIQMTGFVNHLVWVFMPRIPFGSPLVWLVLMGVFYVLLAVMLLRLSAERRRLAVVWLACAVAAALPGLVVPRPNNLQLPILFYGLFVATVLGSFAMRSRAAAVVCDRAGVVSFRLDCVA